MRSLKWNWLGCFATLLWWGLVLHDWYLIDESTIDEFNSRAFKDQLANPPIDTNFSEFIEEALTKKSAQYQPQIQVDKQLDSIAFETNIENTHRPADIKIEKEKNQTEQDSVENSVFTEKIEVNFSTISLSEQYINLLLLILSILGCILIQYGIKQTLIYIRQRRRQNVAASHLEEDKAIVLSQIGSAANLIKNVSHSKIPTYQFRRSLSEINIIYIQQNNQNTYIAKKSRESVANAQNLWKNIIKNTRKELTYEKRCTERLNEEIERLLVENKHLNRKLETMFNEKKQLSKKLVSYREQNDKLKREYEELKRIKDSINDNLKRLQEDLKVILKDKYETQKELINLKNYNCKIKNNLDEAKKLIKRYEKDVIWELEREILLLKSRLNCSVHGCGEQVNKTRTGKCCCLAGNGKHDSRTEVANCSDGAGTIRRSRNQRPKSKRVVYDSPLSKIKNDGLTCKKGDLEHIVRSRSTDDVLRNVKNHINNLKHNIEIWEEEHKLIDNVNISKNAIEDDLQISDIFHTCSENSNDESSECGLASGHFYYANVPKFCSICPPEGIISEKCGSEVN